MRLTFVVQICEPHYKKSNRQKPSSPQTHMMRMRNAQTGPYAICGQRRP